MKKYHVMKALTAIKPCMVIKPVMALLTVVGLSSSVVSYAVDQRLFDLPEPTRSVMNKTDSSNNTNTAVTQRTMGLATTLEVPDLGAAPSLFEQQQERKVGEMVLREVGKQMPLYEDAWTQDEINKVFSRIYTTASIGAPLGLVLIEDNSINAFAVPGGLFALNTGLILSARTIDEIAGVMGHEVAHVSQRHYSRSKDAFKNQAWLTLGGMLASILLASQSSDAAGAVALGTQAAMLDRQLSYSRNQEREADRVGMQLMYAAGYNPLAMADFFEVMNRKTGSISYMPDFWLTHPLSSERMSEARLRAAQYPKQRVELNLTQEQTLRLMQYRIEILTDQMTQARLMTAAQRDPVAVLALAMWYTKQGQYDLARTMSSQAETKLASLRLGSLSIVSITRANIELKANQPQQALDILLPKHRVAPENRALAIETARAYIALNQGQAALDILQPFSQNNPRDVLVWQQMEAAANRLANSEFKTLQVLRFRAENLFWRGEVDTAIKSLIRAGNLAKNNYSMQVRIESRLKEMQEARQFRP